ncbi:hypothetical protein E3N88_39460 [Mikania micrantha]|uniref:Sulfotransferase n=1 Tax=Mikania micrantha TaxID=192012 RepID=A0A5N6LWU2_9ASTR|nr:hypothetical protein E3N88_39460 [Mikania micrantha]
METTKTKVECDKEMEELIKTLPQHSCRWLQGTTILYKYQDFWCLQDLLKGTISAQQSFKARPNDVFLCSFPKSGTTWLKALVFAIITRENFAKSMSPLLTTLPHDCIPSLGRTNLEQIQQYQNKSCFTTPISTHLPHHFLPESILTSNCKIVYIYRNMKDVIVSFYHFARGISKLSMEDAPFEEAFDEFYHEISYFGQYLDHILGYWKASLERPEMFHFVKYEDMKNNPTNNVKKLAEFVGHPFTNEEEKEGVIENIIKLCSFENLSGLEVNKSDSFKGSLPIENRLFFRKAEVGDWKNYFTDEMSEKIDKLIDEKLSGTGLVLK